MQEMPPAAGIGPGLKKQGSQINPYKNIRIEVPNAIKERELESQQGHTEHDGLALTSPFVSSHIDHEAEARSPLVLHYGDSDSSPNKISSSFLDNFFAREQQLYRQA